MPSWLLKAAVQGAISLLPGRHHFNSLLQQRVTGSLVLSKATFDAKVSHCRHHLERFRRVRDADGPPAAALELGTGWYPIVPVGLALAGAPEVTSIDVTALLEAERVRRTLDMYAAALASGRLAGQLPGLDPTRAKRTIATARERVGATAEELLATVGVRALLGDARASGLPAGSIELFVSNNTLEHIAPDALAEILAEFGRLSAPGAVMDHFVDISDHYAHFDRSITEFNYLRYPPAVWRFFNNSLQYQNRLRASDYRRLMERAGFTVIAEEPARGAPEQLARIRLARAFRGYGRADLLVLRSWFTAVA
ncbi:MAG: class I SAM-dependent methyltransferase [Solirubrobacterales bacterium]|nr:class I SAM-dependent methyltransferase [Solirubrobacterales bacterium]MBV9165780.1 class I SAM-dependent methyltransferase [Solirubrobacterales bacterium]